MVMNTPTLFIFGTDSDVVNICAYALKLSGYTVQVMPDLVTLHADCLTQSPDLVLLQHDGLVQGSATVALYHALRMDEHTVALPIIIIRCERLDAQQQYARAPDPAFAIFPIVFSIEELRATVARLLA
jgi:DNA-binding response OmpR family regulator